MAIISKSIIVAGEGGQGIKEITHTLGKILMSAGNEVAIFYDYDAGVRGGKITAYLKFAKDPIRSPFIAKADILVRLSDRAEGYFKGKEEISDSDLKNKGLGQSYPFNCRAIEKFGQSMFASMIVVGKLLKMLGWTLTEIDWPRVLPQKYRDLNRQAIIYGYQEMA